MGKNNKKGNKPLVGPAAVKVGKARSEVRDNPFEVKINKLKFNVLGRKSKHDVGLPGVSKSKAIKRRTETLLKEYKQRGKSSMFTDKRFGEYDAKLDPEEKMMKRFAMARQRNADKKTVYNLNEEEELTHFGQSLAVMEKLNDPVDSDSDTDERGALSAALTASHFGGGGLLRKKAPSEQNEEESEKPKTRKELIEELIAKSKSEKRERQSQREKALELTEKLDSDWKNIQTLLAHRTPKSERKPEIEKPKPDDYDKIVRELGFEMKAQPSDRMKSEEEIAKEEQERLQKLEAERLRRMRGEDGKSKKKAKHISADDLMDGFVLDNDDRLMLSYKDGKMNIPNSEDEKNAGTDGNKEEEPVEEDEGSDVGEEGDEAGENATDGSEEEEDGSEEEDDEGSDASDNYSDLESNAESAEEDGEEEVKPKNIKGKTKEKEAAEASSQLPFTFDVPESQERFQSVLTEKPIEQQLIILERIQKCNHPSLADGNKAKLEKLFGFLLDYIIDLAEQEAPDLKTIDKLILPLYSLCQMFPEKAADCVREALRDITRTLDEAIESKGRATFPALHVLLYFKITAILFPTSDFWHPVVTPAVTVMSQLLTKCPVSSLEDVAAGLFICSMFLEYVSLSQRFVPEVINFLLGILHLATVRRTSIGYYVVPPFKHHGKSSELLLADSEEDMKSWKKTHMPLTAINGLDTEDQTEINHFRLTCVAVSLDLVKRCVNMYGSLPAFQEIFNPISLLINEHLPRSTYPQEIQDVCRNILNDIKRNGKKSYKPLVFEKQGPVPMKMFTPKVMPVLEFGKKQGCNKVEQERKKLIHKHKRELKGAVREIRRDNQFLARVKLSETMDRDVERKRKVKELFNSLSNQEGEWKALKRRQMKGK
ncbi:PREDICTED: nucleolar protein 14 [Nanorana parkeri]|uniref:nucleolar protein 14 n=1 Tax=Nanorana parkeri TaxID=125878 RepID=UPI00085405FD|nr:PREDICTED: nucleolar protein 14 [Nanorana parkeri]